MNTSLIRATLAQCTIITGYSGLDEIKEFARRDPAAVLSVIWSLLEGQEDPGKDDGALCLELLRIAASQVGRHKVESLFLSNWDKLSEDAQRNLIHGFADQSVISVEIIVELFNRPTTNVRQRHLIVSVLASSRADLSHAVLLELTNRIGKYHDTARQEVLDHFLKSVIANCGINSSES